MPGERILVSDAKGRNPRQGLTCGGFADILMKTETGTGLFVTVNNGIERRTTCCYEEVLISYWCRGGSCPWRAIKHMFF